jgi:hypothetical protein
MQVASKEQFTRHIVWQDINYTHPPQTRSTNQVQGIKCVTGFKAIAGQCPAGNVFFRDFFTVLNYCQCIKYFLTLCLKIKML